MMLEPRIPLIGLLLCDVYYTVLVELLGAQGG